MSDNRSVTNKRRDVLERRIATNKKWLDENCFRADKQTRRSCQSNIERDEEELAAIDEHQKTVAAETLPSDADKENTLLNFWWLSGRVTIMTYLGISDPTDADIITYGLVGPAPWIELRTVAWWSKERNGQNPLIKEWKRFLSTKTSLTEIRNALEELEIEARAAVEEYRQQPRGVPAGWSLDQLRHAPPMPPLPRDVQRPAVRHYDGEDLDYDVLTQLCGVLRSDGRYCGYGLGICPDHDTAPSSDDVVIR